mmetsp:Transcript_25908/g.31447  ORF Transcript_25908/g.31447 Transcript_25908/m.31447 type:complete len:483 (+) Transcript_25908:2-1450(+)
MNPIWSIASAPPLLGQPYDEDTSKLDKNAKERRRLDLYHTSAAEAGVGPVPLMIFVHGGGWRGKDSSDVLTKLETIDWREYGYSVASLGYRLSQHAVHPAQIEDVKDGVSWLRAHAAEHNLDPERFIIFGTSAGGHLSSLLATTASQPTDKSRVAAVMDFFGPTYFGQAEEVNVEFGESSTSSVALLLGCAPLDCPEKFADMQPAMHLDASDPPMLIIHGTGDETVVYQTSEFFYNKAIEEGVDATLVISEGATHFYNSVLKANKGFTVTPEAAARDTPVDTMLSWLRERGLVLSCNGTPTPGPTPGPTPSPSPTPAPPVGPIDDDNEGEEDQGTIQSCVTKHCMSQVQACRKDKDCESLLLSDGGNSNPDLNQLKENAQALTFSECACTACPQFGISLCDALLMEPSPTPTPPSPEPMIDPPEPSPTPTPSPITDSPSPESPSAGPESAPTPVMDDTTSSARMFTLSLGFLLAVLCVVDWW